MTAAEFLARARAVTDGATPGPWSAYGSWPFDVIGDGLDPDGGTQVLVTGTCGREADSHFAAASRTMLPAAVAAIEAVLALADKWTFTGHGAPDDMPDEVDYIHDGIAADLRDAVAAHLDPS